MRHVVHGQFCFRLPHHCVYSIMSDTESLNSSKLLGSPQPFDIKTPESPGSPLKMAEPVLKVMENNETADNVNTENNETADNAHTSSLHPNPAILERLDSIRDFITISENKESDVVHDLFTFIYTTLLPNLSSNSEACMQRLEAIYEKWINLDNVGKDTVKKQQPKVRDILSEYKETITKDKQDVIFTSFNKICVTKDDVLEHIKNLDGMYSQQVKKSLHISYYIGKYLCYLQHIITEEEFQVKSRELKLNYAKTHASFLRSLYKFLVKYPNFLNCSKSQFQFKGDFSKLKVALKKATPAEVAFWRTK